MTTSIITNLLGPMCEMFYKYKTSLDIYEANINTIRGYGYNTSFSLNFGFEIFEPLDINNISLQPGVFTTQSVFATLPDLSVLTKIGVANSISLQELPGSGSGLATYVGKTLHSLFLYSRKEAPLRELPQILQRMEYHMTIVAPTTI